MSEKVGSGAGSVEELGQEQVLLDWQDLPSFGALEAGNTQPSASLGSGAKSEEVVAELSAEAEGARLERLTAQARGELLLRATAESLGEENVESFENGGEVRRVGIEREGVVVSEGQAIDTVLLRAEQALGREQFLDLTKDLMATSMEKTPDEVMEKFRGEAQKYSMVDAGDLWEAVVRQAKTERFGGQRDKVKFYYSTSLEDLAGILREGKLKRQDGESNALKSDLRLSYDYQDADGEWKSGFDDEREGEARDVTMIFDGVLLDEDGFAAFGKNPTVEAVDLEKYCLGLVVGDEIDRATALRAIRYNGGGMLPVFTEEFELEGQPKQKWGEKFWEAGAMRMAADWQKEQLQRQQELSEKLYNCGADDLIRQNLKFFAERLATPKIESFYEKYDTVKTMEGRRQAITELVKYFGGEVFGIGTDTSVKFYNDANDQTLAKCVAPGGIVRVNEAHLGESSWKDLMERTGHEMQHRFQLERARHYGLKLQDPRVQTTEYNELCHYNYMNYIEGKVDFGGYCRQFIEREAYGFGGVVREKCEAVERKMRTPSERVRRMARKAGGKIMDLSKKVGKHE